MTRLLALAVVAILSAIDASAQTVRIRSGEHAGFTRFVFYLPAGISAETERREGAIRVSLSPGATGFDTSDAFDRVRRDRVTGIRAASGRMAELLLTCECSYTAQRSAGNLLVIDVSDGPPARAERRLELPRPYRTSMALLWSDAGLSLPTDGAAEYRIAPRRVDPPDPAIPALDAPPPPASQPGVAKPRMDLPIPATLPDLSNPQTLARQNRVREAEAQLAEQLARAASQGLLALTDGAPPPARRAGAAGPSDPDQPPPDAPLAAETSIDRAYRNSPRDGPVNSDGDACFGDDLLDLADWGGAGEFGDELGRRRQALFSETDARQDSATRDLARFYIRHGFGAEALQVLATHPAPTVEIEVLSAMARIVDHGRDRPTGIFSGQIDCDTAAALWAALADDDPGRGFPPNTDAILRHLGALPADLRAQFAPVLSERFLALGDHDASDMALRLAERAGGPQGDRHDLARAKLDLETGDQAAALEGLSRAAEGGDRMAPEALIALIDLRLSRGEDIPPGEIDLALAYSVELRGQPLALPMERSAIIGTAHSGDFDGALDRLSAWPDVPASLRDDVRSHVARAIARLSADLDLIRLTGRLVAESPDRLRPDVGNDLAERLLILGFGDLAIPLLSGPAEGAKGDRRRLLRARIALAENRPRRALAELLNLSTPEARRLRAEALAMGGDHAEASDSFAALDAREDALREAWLAGNWQRVAELSPDARGQAAQLMLGPKPQDTDTNVSGPDAASADGDAPPGVLDTFRSQAESARNAREVLDRLLADVPPPLDAPS